MRDRMEPRGIKFLPEKVKEIQIRPITDAQEKENAEAAKRAEEVKEAIKKFASEMEPEAAREQVAWLARSLEMVAMGQEDIQIKTCGEPATKEQTELWAMINASAIRKLLEANGLSTAWH